MDVTNEGGGEGKVQASSSFFHDIQQTDERSSTKTSKFTSTHPKKNHPFQRPNIANEREGNGEGEGNGNHVKVYKDDMFDACGSWWTQGGCHAPRHTLSMCYPLSSPCQYILSIHPLNTSCQCILLTHQLILQHINSSSQYTLYQPTLSPPIITPYHHITPYQPNNHQPTPSTHQPTLSIPPHHPPPPHQPTLTSPIIIIASHYRGRPRPPLHQPTLSSPHHPHHHPSHHTTPIITSPPINPP